MRPLSKRLRFAALFAAGIIAGAGVYAAVNAFMRPPAAEPDFGVTFSVKYAKELGLDWRKVYLDTLDDLGVRKFRIPVYWDDVEREEGNYDWSETDWMLEEAAARGAEVILVVGRKTPRWPECHVPGWAQGLSEAEQQARVLDFLEQEIRHFKTSPAVRWWQVENEPLFHFGKCPMPDREFLKREINLARSLDTRKIMVTDSGELSTWIRTAALGDVLGISMYRLVWNKHLGDLYWPVSPLYYAERANLISPVVKTVIISELQTEPWFRKPVDETPLSEQLDTMSLPRFMDNVEFAESTGVPEIYLWGVEWWYWVRGRGHGEFWEASRALFRDTL